MFSNKDVLAGLVFFLFGLLTLLVLIPVGIQQPPSVQYQALSPSYWPNIVAGAITAIRFVPVRISGQLLVRGCTCTAPDWCGLGGAFVTRMASCCWTWS